MTTEHRPLLLIVVGAVLLVLSFVFAAFDAQHPEIWIVAGLLVATGEALTLGDYGGSQDLRRARWESGRERAAARGQRTAGAPGIGASVALLALGVIVFAMGLAGTLGAL